ncbi:Putative tyrosine-protein phosphatase [Cupriavidus oxalaticus]|uniref:tyrosine-protein phosphatase n=1 Tax=Cupriavidus oxalaticus TaxID=96344 RepID=UPI003F740CA4
MNKWFRRAFPHAHAIVPPGPATDGTVGNAALAFDTISNARDLGGLRGAAGRRVRSGRLYRSGNPALASAADLDRLHALDLDMVVDFRSAGEKSPDEAGFGERFNWVAVPVLDGSMAMDVLMPRLRASTPAQIDGFMLEVYRDFPVRYRDAFGGFMQTAQAGKTLLFHCTAGKDRTGFASLLLLSALGVAQDDILANYLESNQRNARFNETALARMAQLGVSAEAMMPLLEVRASYLDASLQAIEQGWGSVDNYLGDALAVDVAQLRAHYLED